MLPQHLSQIKSDLHETFRITSGNWNILMFIVPDGFEELKLSGHAFCKIEENQCIFIGGYSQENCSHNDTASDNIIKIVVNKERVVSVSMKQLGCGPIAQASLLKTPVSSLHDQKRCLLMNSPDLYSQDTVNWLLDWL